MERGAELVISPARLAGLATLPLLLCSGAGFASPPTASPPQKVSANDRSQGNEAPAEQPVSKVMSPADPGPVSPFGDLFVGAFRSTLSTGRAAFLSDDRDAVETSTIPTSADLARHRRLVR